MKISPTTRKYIYSVLVAAVPVAVIYGLVSQEEASVWIGLGAAILGVAGHGLALANTPKDENDPESK